MKHPSREECFKLLKEYQTPPHVIRHCIAVTDVALRIGEALNSKGYSLNLDLIQGAALIHDIARLQDKHWEVGSKIAADLGYQREADIIMVHMHYTPAQSAEDMTETDLVCLADRVVLEDEYVGIDRRMDAIIAKVRAQQRDGVEAHILQRKREAQGLIDEIEKKINMTLDMLMER